jgi:hypothetical protein
VEETIPRRGRAVGPLLHAIGPDELLAAAEHFAPVLHRLDLGLETRRERRGRERAAGHAGRLQQPLLVEGEPGEPLLDHLTQALRHGRVGRRPLLYPRAAAAGEPCARVP